MATFVDIRTGIPAIGDRCWVRTTQGNYLIAYYGGMMDETDGTKWYLERLFLISIADTVTHWQYKPRRIV